MSFSIVGFQLFTFTAWLYFAICQNQLPKRGELPTRRFSSCFVGSQKMASKLTLKSPPFEKSRMGMDLGCSVTLEKKGITLFWEDRIFSGPATQKKGKIIGATEQLRDRDHRCDHGAAGGPFRVSRERPKVDVYGSTWSRRAKLHARVKVKRGEGGLELVSFPGPFPSHTI